ncbi:MAG: helix-turn-helix transcriptional regulator [Deltaproteobacteria bacterium]|nr:helix-turn-helix transcriptional regulator [Deltaproteobacteria bacterium]
MTTRGRSALKALERSTGGPLTLGEFLAAIRKGEGWSLAEMGEKLGVSRTHLWEIEQGRRSLSPDRAAKFARILGYHQEQMVELALQAILDQLKLKLKVHVQRAAAARPVPG